MADYIDFMLATRQRHGIIPTDRGPDYMWIMPPPPASTSCAYCDAKLATCARKCDNCGAAVKDENRG